MSETERLLDLVKPLLSEAGFTEELWSATLLSRRNDSSMHRIVVKLSSHNGQALVAKHIMRPINFERFAKSVDRQTQIAATAVRAPRIYGVDKDRQIVLMELLHGSTLYDACHLQSVSDHAPFLEASGRWVDCFHRAVKWESREFRSKFAVSSLSRLRKQILARETQVPKRTDFLAMLEATLDSAVAIDRSETVAAVGHGDLNLRNIVIDKHVASGLDFGDPGLLPVAHDLARLFCHYGALCVKPGTQKGGPLPGVDLNSFYRGYKLVAPEDLSVSFMCRVRLLWDWAKIPQKSTERSISEQIRLKGIQKLVQKLGI